MNNTLEHSRLKFHVPDFYSSINNSNDSDDTKVEKFKNQNWVTYSLLEEMSRYYPTKDDVTRGPSINDISINKESFSLNFRKMFPAARVFINHIEMREISILRNIFVNMIFIVE